jgi:hypothetical protein
MTCFHPMTAFRREDGTITFTDFGKDIWQNLTLPCGQCIGCRIQRSRMWAIRCMHEASLHENNCFLTLTYSDEHIPEGKNLYYPHYQGFMKRLRKRFQHTHKNIRFYMCGEYGDSTLRPHYHALLFNFDFEDKKVFFKTQTNNLIYRSNILEQLWPYGQSSIGSVTEQSAGYVARYVVKKMAGRSTDINPKTNKPFNAVYDRLNAETGEITKVQPEFTRMSLKPGIAQKWFDQFYNDVYPADAVVSEGGRKMKPPRFYDTKYELINPMEMDSIKQQRILDALKNYKEASTERLAVKEQVLTAKTTQLKRTLQ